MYICMYVLCVYVCMYVCMYVSDASAGGESPVRAPLGAGDNGVRVSVAGTAQRPESVSGRRGPCPAYRVR